MVYHKTGAGIVALPDKHRYARIVRFVPGGDIPGLACDFDHAKNLLRINKDVYDVLPPRVQLRLFRSQETVEVT